LFRLNALARERGTYDILHIHNMPDFLVFCAMFQRLAGTKVILDVHDLMSEVYQSKYGLASEHWLPKMLRVEEKISVNRADAVIAANHAFADILTARSVKSGNVAVVMNAANQKFFLTEKQRAQFRANKPEGDFHVIYIGTVAPRYGVDNAVRALALLHREGSIPGLRFSIIPKFAHEGEHLLQVLGLIDESGLKDRFELMNSVPHDAMPGVIAEADALVYAPVPDIHMDIALSLKIPEAIAVGCPVVSSRLSVNTRYFGDDALYVFAPGDHEACAAQLKKVFEDPQLRKRKMAVARVKLEEVAWKKQAAVYLELVNRLKPKAEEVVANT
jgi:glycosyltransferase involved in cell wall biosynthesis